MQYSRRIKKIVLILFCFFAFFLVLNFNISLPSENTNSNKISTDIISVQLNKAYAYELGQPSLVTRVLSNDPTTKAGWVRNIYHVCLGVVNVLLVVVLFIVAFANILHINIETYQIKKMIPRVIFTAIAANIALVVIALFSRMIDSLQTLSFFNPLPLTVDYFIGFNFAGITGTGVTAFLIYLGGIAIGPFYLLACCVGCLIFLIPAVILILPNLILAVRPWVIYLAAAISPIAIACSVLPQTEAYFKKWLNYLVIWMCLPLIVFGLIYIAGKIPQSMPVAGGGLINYMVGFVLPIIIRFALIIIAIRAPFTLDKDIGGLIAKIGTTAGRFGWQKTGDVNRYISNKRKGSEIVAKSKARQGYETEVRNGIRNEVGQKMKVGQTNPKTGKATTQEDIEEEIDKRTTKHFASKEGKEALAIKEGEAFKSLTETFKYKAQTAALGVSPYGLLSSWKQRQEFGEAERQKTFEKYSILSAGVKGKELQRKYRDAVIKEDISSLDSLEDVKAYSRYAWEQVIENIMKAENIGRKQARAKARLELARLRSDQESVGSYFSSPVFKGLELEDYLLNVKNADARMQMLAGREVRARGGAEKREEREQAREGLIDEILDKGAPSGPVTLAGQPTLPPRPWTHYEVLSAADKKIIALLREIAAKDVPGAITESISRVGQGADRRIIESINPANFDRSNDMISDRLRELGASDIASELQASGGINITGAVNLNNTSYGGNPEFRSLIDAFRTNQLSKIGVMANTEEAQETFNLSNHVIIKQNLAPPQIQQLQDASMTVIKQELKLDPNINPAQYEQARKVIADHLGRDLNTISASTAAPVLRSIEATTARGLASQRPPATGTAGVPPPAPTPPAL